MKYCLACGMPLDRKYNNKWDKKVADFCNEQCQAQHVRDTRPKERKKYGLTGYIYD